jgi:hypothetical protein
MEKPNVHQQSFLPRLPFSRYKTTDSEYVAKIAKSMKWWDRWRWLALPIQAAVIAAIVWFGFNVVELVKNFQGLNQNANVMAEEVVLVGIVLGLKVGFFLHSSVMGLFQSLSGFRTERLLIRIFYEQHGETDIQPTPE